MGLRTMEARLLSRETSSREIFEPLRDPIKFGRGELHVPALSLGKAAPGMD